MRGIMGCSFIDFSRLYIRLFKTHSAFLISANRKYTLILVRKEYSDLLERKLLRSQSRIMYIGYESHIGITKLEF